MSKSENKRRSGFWVSLFFALVGLAVGVVGGLWLSRGGLWTGPSAPQAEVAESGKLYTCGMHPNVIQEGPGNCPICGMKLTPVKAEETTERAEKGPKERKVLYWRAPMDPNYISDKPGKSPMGMDLVPVYAKEGEIPSAHTIRIDPVTIQNMGIRTAVLKRGPLVRIIRTVGRVDYNEELVTFINTKFQGWIEKLYVNQTGQHVSKGDRLFDVYSPQLYSAQEEYLAALRGMKALSASSKEIRDQARRLLEAARIKLRYLDVSDEQIDELARTATIQKTLTIHSPSEGIVTEKMALEGMYVKPGMELYTIADLSRVWVYVDVYEYQLPWVRIGQTATMNLSYVPGKKFVGTVVYIYPYLEPQTRVIKVRLEFENPTLELKPDMYATVMLEADLGRQALLIPREAYIDSGLRKVAFIDLGGGKFQPREIQTGLEGERGMVEVLYGLDEGDVVVTSGQFMLDAESKLKEAIAKMMEIRRKGVAKKPAGQTGGKGEASAPAKPTTPASQPATMPADARFACPMETHPDQTDPTKQGPYFSDQPGQCPRCGMKLKPIEDLPWARLADAAQGAKVAYTCPDHPHVFSETPGKCPRCGKTLQPFKVMYTCPNPEHSGLIDRSGGRCPRCGSNLVPFRGIWLTEDMAEANLPPTTQPAEQAAYHCPTHPLVHSDQPGACTICAGPLVKSEPSTQPTTQPVGTGEFLCPMHPQIRSPRPGLCPICAMQLVPKSHLKEPATAPARVNRQLSYITEHYLALHRLLASDSTKDVARHALAIAAAAEQMLKHIGDMNGPDRASIAKAVRDLRAAAVKINGTRISRDRIEFVRLSRAMKNLLDYVRPDKKRWPKLYIFRCPMTKGYWIQSGSDVANPYYGFKMLKCGNLKATR